MSDISLADQIAALLKAAEPFCRKADQLDDPSWPRTGIDEFTVSVSLGDLCRLRDAVRKVKEAQLPCP